MPDVVVIKEVKEDAVSVVLPGLCGGFLPRAESLEEEEECEAPDHGGAHDAEQRDELDPLAAPELGKVCSRQPRLLPDSQAHTEPNQVHAGSLLSLP